MGILKRSAIVFSISISVIFSAGAAQAGVLTTLDDLQSTVQATTVQWMNNSLALGTTLFTIMITLSFVSALARYIAVNHTVEGIGHMFMDIFMKVIPLYVIVSSASTFMPGIVNAANALAGQITTVSINGPSDILYNGIKICGNILHQVIQPMTVGDILLHSSEALFTTVFRAVVAVIACLIVMASFTLIAFEYFFAFVQSYITLSIGAFAIGWIGAPGTKSMGEAYLAGAWMSVMRLVVTIACSSLIMSLIPKMQILAQTDHVSQIVVNWLWLMAISVFGALMALRVPDFAMNIFSGVPAISALSAGESLAQASSAAGKAGGSATQVGASVVRGGASASATGISALSQLRKGIGGR